MTTVSRTPTTPLNCPICGDFLCPITWHRKANR